ncbi:50S ribosomal protein L7/L12 [Thermomonospora amylolytica]|uniref:50S ribosomal protein L7/L12 n=1 Tax=Thermomonospora amylolytica TaxID=1411117 RepID=UPI001300A104|nr:50S ribosomal protein L7/L12 [Thermomonospora amylolytica]
MDSLWIVAVVVGGPLVLVMALVLVAAPAGMAMAKASRPPRPPREVTPAVWDEAKELVDKGQLIHAVKVVRQHTGMSLKDAKDYVDAVKDGRAPRPLEPGTGRLSDRVRAFRDSGDHDSALALVQAETGMTREEAVRFVDALD